MCPPGMHCGARRHEGVVRPTSIKATRLKLSAKPHSVENSNHHKRNSHTVNAWNVSSAENGDTAPRMMWPTNAS